MAISRVKGTRDFSPEDMKKRRYVEGVMRSVFESYGYEEILTPTFEYLELFLKKSGEEVLKHAYIFKDKSGKDLILRPEVTTPVIRFYVSNLRNRPHPLRLYYITNCFRYEEPQAGRYREFWQAGVEIIGTNSPEAMAELIIMADDVLKRLNIKHYEIRIGNVEVLKNLLSDVDDRIRSKILRHIDKGEIEKLKEYDINYEKILSIITFSGGRNELEEIAGRDMLLLMDYLDDAGVRYKVDFSIVRGLDYYSGIVFEIHNNKLGAQKQICGGGVYSLGELFGFDIKACGFAFGLDRVILSAERENVLPEVSERRFMLFLFDKKYYKKALEILRIVRKYYKCEMEIMRKKIKKSLEYANSKGIDFFIIVGEEIEKGYITIKDLKRNVQEEVPIENFEEYIKNL